MEALLAALEATPIAQHLRGARWSYAAVNTAHVLGIALLVGTILPLDLRLLGLWRKDTPQQAVSRLLLPVAAAGLVLALTSGLLLFSVRAREYAEVPFLQAKVAFVALGLLSALVFHATHGLLSREAAPWRARLHGFLSMTCWLAALISGRLIAFSGD